VHQVLEKITQIEGASVDSCEVERTFNDGYTSEEIQRLNCLPIPTFDQTDFYEAFKSDMKKAKSRLVIFSPFVSRKRVTDLLPDFQEILGRNVPIYIVTRSPEYCGNFKSETLESFRDLARIGVAVIPAYKQPGIDDKFEKFHYKVAVIDNSVVYYGSLNILSQVDSSESMMAFRSKKTVAQLVRVFHVSEVIKGKRFEDLKTDDHVKPEMPKINNSQQISPNGQLASRNILPDLSDPIRMAKLVGLVEPGKGVRQRAEDKIARIGEDLGFRSYTWFEMPNLFNDGRTRYISVVWNQGNDIIVAFQVRRKRLNPDIVTSLKDRRKLLNLDAKEKYMVNVSERNGKPYFFRVTNSENKEQPTVDNTKPSYQKVFPQYRKEIEAYDLEEIRKKYPKAYEIWTEAEDKQLISEYQIT
jgi:hypothetical protein